jgi:cytochrome c oxidase subunit 2
MKGGRRHALSMVILGAALVAMAALSQASLKRLPASPLLPGMGAGAAVAAASAGGAQDAPPQRRSIVVVARRYAFSPDRIEVQEGDLVKITFSTEDIPHSFTIDEPLRIAKRATPGHPAVFEFRASPAGTYTFYCNLTAEEGCKKMRGELIVTRPK